MAKKVKPGELRTYPEWVHHELLNWSRWCWLGQWPHPMPPSTCYSFEKNYRRTGEDEQKAEARPAPPIESRARIVQAEWEKLPKLQASVLRAVYPQSMSRDRVMRKLRISREAYDSTLSAACYKIQLALERGE